MLLRLHQLNTQQLDELEQLTHLCQKTDGNIPILYPHILSAYRMIPGCTLYYEEGVLTGFISAFFFYETAVELSLLVSPKARRRGIAKQLLRSLTPLLNYYHYTTLICSSPCDNNTRWLIDQGWTFTHREHHMERNAALSISEEIHELTFRQATPRDLATLALIDKVCFPEKEDLTAHLSRLISDPQYHLLIALMHDEPVGKAHIRWEEHTAVLSDIGILPQFQNKGYGAALTSHCIRLALSQTKPLLQLDVEANNTKALALYTRLGFQMRNTCDYWSNEIRFLLNFGESFNCTLAS